MAIGEIINLGAELFDSIFGGDVDLAERDKQARLNEVREMMGWYGLTDADFTAQDSQILQTYLSKQTGYWEPVRNYLRAMGERKENNGFVDDTDIYQSSTSNPKIQKNNFAGIFENPVLVIIIAGIGFTLIAKNIGGKK